MTTLIAGQFALGVHSGAEQARTVFDDTRDTTRRADGTFGNMQNNTP